MKEKMRKETKIGLLLFAIFNVLRFMTNEIGTENFILHFFLGGVVGLALAYLMIGLLPEAIYLKLKNYKRKYIPFIK